MKRLWVHEVIRIYHDRITDQYDSDWFMDNLRSVTSNQLKENLDVLLQHLTNNQEPQVISLSFYVITNLAIYLSYFAGTLKYIW